MTIQTPTPVVIFVSLWKLSTFDGSLDYTSLYATKDKLRCISVRLYQECTEYREVRASLYPLWYNCLAVGVLVLLITFIAKVNSNYSNHKTKYRN